MTVQLENVSDIYTLSPMQEGMLYHTLAEPRSGVFVSQVIAKLGGKLDLGAFESAWEKLVQRHEALRSAIVWEGLDEPLQVIRDRAPLDWTVYDWSQDTESQKKYESFLARDRERGFDMSSAPLMRMSLIRLGHESWRWVWTCHHIVCDGWSAQILLEELTRLYQAETTGESAVLPPTFAYKDYLSWLAGRETSDDEKHWRSRLGGFSEPHRLDVPGLPPREGSGGYRNHTVDLGIRETFAITGATSAIRVTTNAFVLAAWSVVLSRWMRTRDVVFGVTTSGRSTELVGVESAVGLFINTLPMRLDVAPGASFSELTRSSMSEQLAISEREHVPLSSVQRWTEVPPGRPLFESIFVFENFPIPQRAEATELRVSDIELIEQSNYPLAVLVHPGDSMRLSFVFDSATLSEDAVRSLGRQMRHILRQTAKDPETAVSSLQLINGSEDDELSHLSSGPRLPETRQTILEAIAGVAAADPGAIAVVDEHHALTYGELRARAGRLTSRLRSSGVQRGDLVGLMLPRRVDFIVGILATLQSGGVYVPLDPAYPESHLRRVLEEEDVAAVLTDSEYEAWLPPNVKQVNVAGVGVGQGPDPEWQLDPDDLAYVIHTSGSTGRPKGVMVDHGNLLASTRARMLYYGEPVENFLLLSSFAFDSSIAGIFWTLASGGKLVIPPARIEQDMTRLLAFAESNVVTHLLALPSLYEIMLEEAGAGQLGSLRVAIVAGESCPPSLVTSHFSRIPDAQLHNEYGPTETTVWCTAHRITLADAFGSIPIGRPIPGAETFVLDQYGHQAPWGFAGEIHVGGSGVAQGYHKLPELTRSRFPTLYVGGAQRRTYGTGDLACFDRSGEMVFLGRADAQVKVRGHRIELTAVESAIRSLDDVEDTVVRAVSSPNGKGNRLIAYAVRSKDRNELSIGERLRSTLPAFMVPDVVVDVENVPRLPNGKVDTNGLPDPERATQATELRRPTTDSERVLARIWEDLLDLDEVGVDDDYFEVGGDSLLSIRLFSRIQAETGVSLPLNALLNNRTIHELAGLLDDSRSDSSSEWRSLVPIREMGSEPSFGCVHAGGGHVIFYRHLAALLPDESPVYGLEPIGLDGSTKPIESVEEMAALYVSELRRAQPNGPYRLIGYCMGGSVSLEMARQLESDGHCVELLTVIDSGIAIDPLGSSVASKIKREFQLGGVFGLVSFLGHRLAARTLRAWKLKFGGPEGEREAAHSLVQRACRRAVQTYTPIGIEAPILLVRSTEYAQLDTKTFHMNWGDFTPDLRIKVVEAEHRTILERPDSVAAVAQAIRDELASGP